jgi:trans-aconitate methyltransferase
VSEPVVISNDFSRALTHDENLMMKTSSLPETNWNASLYENKHAFVWQFGESLIELLSPRLGEQILDLGCGTGQLTEKIAIAGATVQGMDASPEMIEKASQNYPHLLFRVADARSFQVEQPLDAVFSNAVLHWIKEPDAVIECVGQALKPGGRFVVEMGGKGNVSAIVTALDRAFAEQGHAVPEAANPWYFPSLGDYISRLEGRGFEVVYAVLFDRPTVLEAGEAGLANWLQMFADCFLGQLTAAQQTEVIHSVETQLRSTHFQDGNWVADYRRIRLIAIKR